MRGIWPGLGCAPPEDYRAPPPASGGSSACGPSALSDARYSPCVRVCVHIPLSHGRQSYGVRAHRPPG